MEALQALLTRRSIRRYTSDPLPAGRIEELLNAAMHAPSAGNQQPWHFIVLDDRSKLDAIPSFHPHSLMMRETSVAVLVCGDPTLEKHAGYWVQDCSAATQNLLIAVHAAGLGAVWVGVYPREDRINGFRSLLGLPGHIVPFSLVPIGYPAESKPQPDRFNASRIHRNSW